MRRPTSFDEIRGHEEIVSYFKEQIENKSLPHFLIIEGEEGLGKTSLADIIAVNLVYGLNDSPDKRRAINDVIVNNKNTPNIKKYEMTIEGGKNAAVEIISEFNTALTKGVKVIICDECHGMSDAAQDVFLADTDSARIPDNLYLIMLTTEIASIKATLRSRSVPIHLSRLKFKDMMYLLQTEVYERNLNIQGGDTTLSMIAEWAECKPRAALSILNAFSNGSSISGNIIKELIGYLDVEDVLPLVTSLSGSLIWGLDYIRELQIRDGFVSILIEILKVRLGHPSYRLKSDDLRKVKQNIMQVPEENLMRFVYLIAGTQKLTRSFVVSAFIQSHTTYSYVINGKRNVLEEEKLQKAQEAPPPPARAVRDVVPPTLDSLLANSNIIE